MIAELTQSHAIGVSLSEMEKQIIKAIREDSKLPLASDVGYKDLIKFVKKLFKEYRSE